jgi:hypothetical protein
MGGLILIFSIILIIICLLFLVRAAYSQLAG